MKNGLIVAAACSFVLLIGCGTDGSGGGVSDIDAGGQGSGEPSDAPPADCGLANARTLSTCVSGYVERTAACYASQGAPCASDDAVLAELLRAAEQATTEQCGEGDFGALDAAALPGRIRNACASEASSIAWRTFGGPQGAAWAAANDEERACLQSAGTAAIDLVALSLEEMGRCASEGCDAATLADNRTSAESDAITAVEAACDDLGKLVAVNPETYVASASLGVDCMIAAAHPDAAELALDCGPPNAELTAPRGEWTEIVVDGDKWGTLCGDESEYAFWIRPAPEGERLDRVVVALQGGGVCLFGPDCGPRLAAAPQLFSARGADDVPLSVGIASDDPEVSAFANWTMVYLPYCNQDVFAGGGVVEDLGDNILVPRYGSVNLRAAVRMTRDWLWSELDAAGGNGYRSDEVVAFVGGFSAGAYGALYNYHWFLDDLLWPRTFAFPDGGLAVDTPSGPGVGALGAIKIPAWRMQNNLPPYCFEGACSSGQNMINALTPRLLQVPEQRMILLSNQRDSTQAGDAFFSDDATFINALRGMYCDTRDLPGIHWYLTSVSDESVHVVTPRPELWSGEVDGVVMSDYFEQAFTAPETLGSHVEEGDFVTAVPGVEPFPCTVP
jgi:hypothetical protein